MHGARNGTAATNEEVCVAQNPTHFAVDLRKPLLREHDEGIHQIVADCSGIPGMKHPETKKLVERQNRTLLCLPSVYCNGSLHG